MGEMCRIMARRSSDSPRPSRTGNEHTGLSKRTGGGAPTAKVTLSQRPDFSFENFLIARGAGLVAGVDEVGRGPLAGPVVAAAVVFENVEDVPMGINDSKKLSAAKRSALFDRILANAFVSIASVPAREIDRINIRQATLTAMTAAIERLVVHPCHILVDGRDIPADFAENSTSIIKGDSISLSIAAASIVAKVFRDRLMARADLTYPGYSFSTHVGYGTAAHIAAIRTLGPCPIHRMSFRPLSNG